MKLRPSERQKVSELMKFIDVDVRHNFLWSVLQKRTPRLSTGVWMVVSLGHDTRFSGMSIFRQDSTVEAKPTSGHFHRWISGKDGESLHLGDDASTNRLC